MYRYYTYLLRVFTNFGANTCIILVDYTDTYINEILCTLVNLEAYNSSNG